MRVINIRDYTRTLKEDNLVSCTLFSERFLRTDLRVVEKNTVYSGYQLNESNVMINVIEGEIELSVGNERHRLREGERTMICENESFSFIAVEESVLEFIWAPGLYS